MSVMTVKNTRLIADLKLIAIIASVAAAAIVATFVYPAIFPPDRAEAVVTLDGIEIGRYDLSTDTEVEIRCDSGYNILRIKNGRASVSDADCPEGICTAHFPISISGESIVCLPHRLVIHINYD